MLDIHSTIIYSKLTLTVNFSGSDLIRNFYYRLTFYFNSKLFQKKYLTRNSYLQIGNESVISNAFN